jgi:hypothetical protein
VAGSVDSQVDLTFGGRIYLGAAEPIGSQLPTLISPGGARLIVELPTVWAAQSVSGRVQIASNGRTLGFQTGPIGTLPMNLHGFPDVVPQSIVRFRHGHLAHYRLRWGPDSSAGVTLWQGEWSDVYTAAYASFDEALKAFSTFTPTDDPAGAAVEIPPTASLEVDEVLVDCATVSLAVRRIDSTVPTWDGVLSPHGNMLYRIDEEARVILWTGPSSMAILTRNDGARLSSEDLSAALDLKIDWLPRGVAGLPAQVQ